MSIIPFARDFTFEAHDGRTSTTVNGFKRPQVVHLQEVADLVWASGGTDEEIAAAWLHDTVEDTKITVEDIKNNFGDDVATMVEGLTDLEEITGLPVAERKQKQAERIQNESVSVRRIKIADQISNVRMLAIDATVRMTVAECKDYIEGARKIVDECRGISPLLEKLFDEAYGMGKEKFAEDRPVI